MPACAARAALAPPSAAPSARASPAASRASAGVTRVSAPVVAGRWGQFARVNVSMVLSLFIAESERGAGASASRRRDDITYHFSWRVGSPSGQGGRISMPRPARACAPHHRNVGQSRSFALTGSDSYPIIRSTKEQMLTCGAIAQMHFTKVFFWRPTRMKPETNLWHIPRSRRQDVCRTR
ncbi:hypothetical protein PUN4_270116 [Paraburkholderia unamae]|nr:hypothetical protein PUN4_270116 [Paraburkholderia unamae]